VVYLTQQIYQFRLRGKEFAMQHLGSEDQMERALRDLLTILSPEERLKGLAPEERLRGLTPEELERLRQLLQTQTKIDKPSQPE
jgi:hypothetical protein